MIARKLSFALVIAGYLAGTPCVLNAADSSHLPTFMAGANDVFQGKDDAFLSYVALHGSYQVMSAEDRKQAGQLLSMVDAMFGRYDDAARHYADTFPSKSAPSCPGAPFEARPAVEALAALARDARVVLINESHSKVATRSSIISVLPALRKAGFTHLALEALNPATTSSVIRAEPNMQRHQLPDNVKAGFYLREPVFAQMVNGARDLGFGLVAYESEASEQPLREEEQAANLAHWLQSHPHDRLVVVAGYSHIWKSDGWMAQRLAAFTHLPILSVDQIEGIGGCTGKPQPATPSLWVTPSGQAWAMQPERVDATVIWHSSDARGDVGSWLDLGGRRREVSVAAACGGKRPCLIEARTVDAEGSVPEDRLVLFSASESASLYLSPGRYVLTTRTVTMSTRSSIEVPETRDSGKVGSFVPRRQVGHSH